MRNRFSGKGNNVVNSLIILFFIFLGLFVLATAADKCKGVKCNDPPKTKDTKCKKVGDKDKSVTRPSGPRAKCCPLYKCWAASDPDDYFTFHGLKEVDSDSDEAGHEVVHYGNKGMGRSVTSSATGGHDAIANAMDEDEMEELQKALKEAGML